MKPINAFDYRANEDFSKMRNQLSIKLESGLLDEVRDSIKIPLFWNLYIVIFTQIVEE